MKPAQLAMPLVLLLFACEGQGVGQLSGQLLLRGCNDPAPSPGMTSALPAFSLDPTFFAAEPIEPGMLNESADPRGVKQMIIRMQRSSQRPERTDVFELWLVDVDALRQQQGDISITAPQLSGPSVPLPTPNSGPVVLASIALNGSCPFARVEPVLTGKVRFNQLGFSPGDILDGQILPLSVTDPRAQRDNSKQPDAAGSLSGSFRFSIQRGPASTTP